MPTTAALILAGAVTGSITAFYGSGMFLAASHLTLPPLSRVGAGPAALFFEDFYYRGAKTQVPLAALSTVSSLAAALLAGPLTGRYALLAAAGLSASAMGWTVGVMLPTNDRLVALAKAAGEAGGTGIDGDQVRERQVRENLEAWRWMNVVRAGLTFASGAVGLAALLR